MQTPEQGDRLLGRQFGRFLLTRKLGEGGMGCVYLATRTGEFTQTAAVKLLLDGRQHDGMMARFRAERQVLAALNHPGIVQLLDGGVSEEGIPFLVMDYVDGVPLDEYCAERRTPLAGRVGLVIQILEAVDHAHRRFLAHCDLKFSNILVTAQGELRLLDFGVTKLLDPGLYGVEGEVTQATLRPFTPEFASPEQLAGGALTTSTDIYSMGVLLYSLLTGTHPFEGLRNQPVALLRATCAVTPELPSARAKSAALRGDLDAIVMKALRKEPEGRYASAAHFATDLRSWLERRPVEAHAGSRRYRFVRFAQRHRAGVGAAALLALVMVGGTASTVRQYYRVTESRARADGRFRDLRKMTRVLMLDFYDSVQKLPGAIPAQQTLVGWSLKSLDQLARHGGDDPSLQIDLAEGYLKLADLQANPYENNLGRHTEALETGIKGLAVVRAARARYPGSRDLELTEAKLRVSRAVILLSAGQMPEAKAECERALAMADSMAARYPDEWTIQMEACSEHETYSDMLAGLMEDAHEPEAARAELRKARSYAQRAIAADHTQIRPQRALAVLNMKEGDQWAGLDPSLGLPYFEEARRQLAALPEKVKAERPTRRLVGSLGRREGWALANLRRWDEAIAVTLQAVEVNEFVVGLGPSNQRAQWDLATIYKALAEIYEWRGWKRESIEYFAKLTPILERLVANGASPPMRRALSESYLRMGSQQWDLGRRVEGRANAARGLRMMLEGLTMPNTPRSAFEQAADALMSVRPEELRDYSRALRLLSAPHPDGPATAPDSLCLLGEAYQRTGRKREAAEIAQNALNQLPAPRPGATLSLLRERLVKLTAR